MKVTREELYKMVWAEPMITICKKYGLSDNGLRKHCKKMNIPTPPVGYWEKLKHGKNPEKPKLPKATAESVQSTELSEREVELVKSPDRKKIREAEIENGDIPFSQSRKCSMPKIRLSLIQLRGKEWILKILT